MDANRTQEGVKDLARKIVSLDPVEFDSAINEYFEANAVIDQPNLRIRGSSKIKKFSLLQSLLAKDSQLVGQPKYDSKNQIVSLSFQRTYATPLLPTYIPGSSLVSNKQKTLHWDTDLHLLADEDGEAGQGRKGRKLYVTKVETRRKEKIPFENLIPYYFLRPILSLVAVVIATVAAFYYRHKSDGPIRFILAAAEELITGFWNILLAETGRRQAQAEQWREQKEAQVNRLYGQALSTASELQRNIETGAKNAGIPIEEYKRQANQAVAELRARATEAANYLEANAKNARVPVDEYMRQANQAVEELRGRAADAAKYLETSAKNAGIPVDEYIRQANATIEELRARAAETARYLDGKSKEVRGKAGKASEGGVSLGAKAQEVKSKANEFTNDTNGEGDNLPKTPLGGHDPNAPDAPSYAQASTS